VKVLIVNASDLKGGAARAAYRLHLALLNEGVDSHIIAQSKIGSDSRVHSLQTTKQALFNKFRPILDSIPTRKYESKSLFSSSWVPSSSFINFINDFNPDIVHLHWINDGMIKIEDLEKIKAPIVWSLHDMWPFTGGCHYDESCDAFKKNCGNCVILNSNKQKDLSRKVFNRKVKSYSKIKNLNIIGLSKWLEKCAKDSALFKDKKTHNLPNPINSAVFKPSNKLESRLLWGLPKEKKLILFGAVGATSDERKGFSELSEALRIIDKSDIEFVIFGADEPVNPPDLGCKTHYVGSLHDDISLVTLYSAVDVMIVPSIQENLSNAIMEGMACGRPLVSFDIGGNSDLIEHKINGYLAKPFDTRDLANGIKWVLENKNYSSLCKNARLKIETEFDQKIVGKKYLKLYKGVLNGNN